tara:strand:- start:14 stop:271 length:258 start_codon:yes stop_codon:yes gene_type:complete
MLKTSRPRRLDRYGVVVSSPTTQIPYATVDHNPSNANYLVINFSISDMFKLSIAGIAELAGMLSPSALVYNPTNIIGKFRAVHTI